MKVRCIYKDSKFLEYNKVYEVLGQTNKTYKIQDEEGCESNFYKWKFEEVKEMEKTFREVIADIKPGEVWECTRENARVREIKMYGEERDNLLVFNFGQMTRDVRASIQGGDRFILKRKQYTFEEAFKAYEEGKEIEDCSGFKYKNGEFKANGSLVWRELRSIPVEEIRGKWYIND